MADISWFKVLADIFEDEKIKIIQSMRDGDTLIVMWFKLLAQAAKTNAGGYIYLREDIPYTPAMLATLFGKSQATVEEALTIFRSYGMLDADERGYIFLTNWEKHQNTDKMEKIKEQTRMRVQAHREKKRLELMECNEKSVTVTESNATDKEIDTDKENNTPSPKKANRFYSEDDRYYKMANRFKELQNEYLEAIGKSHLTKNSDLQKWADEFRKIVELDNRPEHELGDVIRFALTDTFWRENILSPKKLREKYSQLALKVGAKTARPVKTGVKNENLEETEAFNEAYGQLFTNP